MSYDLDLIKATVSCRRLLEDNGIKVNRHGFAVCPLHGDRDASLKVYNGDRGWCCYGCHKGGDVINLARELYGVDFREALKILNDQYSLGLADGRKDRAVQARISARRADRQLGEERRAKAQRHAEKTMDAWLEADRAVQALADTEITDRVADALRAREKARIAHLCAVERRDIVWDSN